MMALLGRGLPLLQRFDGQALHFGCILFGLTLLLLELPAALFLGILFGQHAFLLLFALVLATLSSCLGACSVCALQEFLFDAQAILVCLSLALEDKSGYIRCSDMLVT